MSKSNRDEWQLLVDKGEYIAAAELLVATTNNPGRSTRTSTRETDYFHAGQCYALAGKEYYPQAISHCAKAHKPERPEWNMYVTATICFLRGDERALQSITKQMIDMIPETSKNHVYINEARLLLEAALGGNFTYRDVYPSFKK